MEHLKTIRAAVCRRHGGFEDASDSQILTLWKALEPDVQARYLAESRPPKPAGKEAAHAPGL